MKLEKQPTASVTVTVGGESGEVTVDTDSVTTGSQQTLTFTTTDWDTAQMVTVSAGQDDDSIDDTATLSHTASGGGYGSVTGNVSVTVDDDDMRGVTLSESSLTVLEGATGNNMLEGAAGNNLSSIGTYLVGTPFESYIGTYIGTYTVVLDSEPTGNVSITVGGTAGTDVTVDTRSRAQGIQNTLTFTPTTWNTAQTVTVTAATDTDTTSDPVVTLTHDVTGADYGSVTAGSVAVTIIEKDAATFSVSGPATVAEDAGTATYTVLLSAEPGSDVTVDYTTSDGTATAGSDYTATSGTLTFTTTSWDTAQTVAVTIANDSVDESNETFTFTLSDAATGSALSASPSVTTTITDDDTRGVTRGVTLSESSLTVLEGATGTYTVVLDSEPTGNVTVTVGGESGEVTVDTGSVGSQKTLTFTTTDWDTAQTVTVSAGQDDDSIDDTATLSHTASGGGYGSVTGNVSVTVDDDDTPALTFTPTALTVDEGASAAYTVALATQPSATVTVTVAGTASTDVTVDTNGATPGNQSTLTFTRTDWDDPQTVTVAAGQDADTTDDTVTLAHGASGGGYASVTGRLAVTVIDDEGPPSPVTNLQVTPGNGSLVVRWTAASHAPSGYSVRWRERRSDSTLSAVSTVTGTSYTIPGLTNGTTYVVRLDTRNAADTGVEPGTHVSETGTPRPPLAAPVMVVTVLAERIELRWDAVDHAEEYELGYREQPAQATDEWPVDESKRWVGPERALALRNLEPGQVYEIRVRALPASDGAYSPSPWSEQSAALASLEATAGLDALPTVGAAATLTGSASGGQEPYGYAWTVTGEPTGSAVTLTGAETAGPSFTPTHVGTYTLRVTVTDGAGTTATAEVSAEAGHPGAATDLAARSGNGALAVSWTAAARAPHGYRVRWRARGPTGLNEGVVVRGTSRRIEDLANGTTYIVRVDTVNAADDGLASGTRVTTTGTPRASASATAGLDALPTVGAAATLTGSASGGQEPYGYAWTVTGEPTGSAVTLTGAETAGPSFTPTHVGTYTLRVTVTDGAGTTATAEVSAEAGHPGAATGLTARSGNGALAVSWTAAARAPHGYRVRWRARGPTGLNEGVVVRGTGHRIESLANGTTYIVRVDTVNAADDGLASGTRVTTTGTPRASGSASAGLPTVDVHDAQGDEGDALAFRITLSQAAGHTVAVRWRTEAGTAQAGADFASAEGSETFEPGETARTVKVQTHDDTHDDPGETFRVLLTDVQGAVVGDGEAVGTIRNRDALPEAWLAHFGRAVAEQALDGVAQRLAADRTQGTQGTLAGAPIGDGGAWSEERTGSLFSDAPTALGDWSEAGLSLGDERTMTVAEALAASRFTLTGERDEAGASVALWGRGAQSRFDARAGATDLDGTLMTGLLGADYGGEDWLGGVALVWSDGEGGYREPGAGSGELEASLGAVIPYASLRASERLGLWGAAGYGAGTMTLTPEGGTATQADLDWSMVAAGLRGELLAPRGASGLTLALVSDALWAQTDSARVEAVGSGSSLAGSESEVTRLRLGLEGRWAVSLEAGGSVAPRVEAGVRHDGGDAGSGVGVELGGGVTWEVPRLGLSLDLAGRTLLAHESDGRRERGLSATVGYDARPGSERGLSLTLRQETGGRAEGGLDALLAPESLDGGLGAAEVPSRWTAEAAYGLPVFGGRLTASPTIGVGLSGPAHDYSLGWRLAPAANPSGFSVGIKATRQQSDDTAPAHGIELELGARW